MATSEFYTCPEDESLLLPGEALLNCSGQDITKKNAGKARNRILTIFPAHLGLPLKLTDCVLGNIRNLNSDTPEFVVSTEQGELIFKGKFEYPSTKFLSITCQPSTAKKTGQSALTDVFDKILVFDEPTLQPLTEESAHTSMFRSSSTNSAMSELFGTQNSCSSETGASGAYIKHFGMSSVADPIRPATAKRVGTSTSATKAPSSSSKNKSRSSAQKNGSPKKRSHSQKSSGSEESGSESDGSSSDGSNSQGMESDLGDDSTSDVEEELGSAFLNDSPVVDRRSSSRRASAAKAVSYRESDEEEEDARSYSSTESRSGAPSPSKASRPKIKPIDITESSEDEVQIVTKPKASRATPKKPAEKAKAVLKPKTAATTTKTTPKASKAPTARKLATSSAKKTKKDGYFSASDSDGGEDSDASASSGENSGPVRVSGRARQASAKPHRVANKSESDGGSGDTVDDSEESDFLFEDTSSSKKRKASAVKPTAQASKPALSAQKAVPAKSSAKKSKLSGSDKEVAKNPAAGKKSAAAKAPAAKRNSKRIDSDDEVITIEDSESNGSDDDYED